MLRSSPKKVYHKVRKILLVDSRDRNPLSSQSNYTVRLPKVYDNVYAVTLKTAEIPFSWYVFSAKNNNLTFEVIYNGGSPAVVTIPEGNYDANGLATALQLALQPVSSTFTVAVIGATSKLEFKAADTFTFRFPVLPKQQPQPTTWWGLGYFMGFTNTSHTAIPPTLIGAPHTLISDFQIQLNSYNYVLMELDFINKQDETAIDNRLSGRVDGCFAKIPVDVNTGDFVFFRDAAFHPLNRSVMSPPLSQIKTLNVKFRHHNGELIDFNNVDHSFTLELELLDNNFDEYSSLDFTALP
jgi:hypothetical protein